MGGIMNQMLVMLTAIVSLFNIEFGNLKKGINQWNIYPKSFHMKGLSQFVDVLLTCPEL